MKIHIPSHTHLLHGKILTVVIWKGQKIFMNVRDTQEITYRSFKLHWQKWTFQTFFFYLFQHLGKEPDLHHLKISSLPSLLNMLRSSLWTLLEVQIIYNVPQNIRHYFWHFCILFIFKQNSVHPGTLNPIWRKEFLHLMLFKSNHASYIAVFILWQQCAFFSSIRNYIKYFFVCSCCRQLKNSISTFVTITQK